MAPLTKDTVEVPKSAGNASPAAPNTSSQSAGHLRSDAVSLEIPVKIHGSRVTEVVLGTTPHTEPFEEETTTMIVFPHGGVVRMSTGVNAAQMLVLTNLKTRQDAICRVVKVRTFSQSQAYVEIEFTHSQPGYWGVQFPGGVPAPAAAKPAAPAPASQAAPPPQVAPTPKPQSQAPSAEISWAPARPAVAPPVTPPPATPPPVASVNASRAVESKPAAAPSPAPSIVQRPPAQESAFISLGSQEAVEPAATNSKRPTAAERVEAAKDAKEAKEIKDAPKKAPVVDFPEAPPSKPIHSLTMQELLGDELDTQSAAASSASPEEDHSPSKSESHASSPRPIFGSLTGGATLAAAHATPAEDFGARLDFSLGDAPGAEPREKNWFMIAAIIALAFAGAVGAVIYVRGHMGGSANSQTSAKSAPISLPAPSPSTNAPSSSASAPQLPPSAPAQPVSTRTYSAQPNVAANSANRSALNASSTGNTPERPHVPAAVNSDSSNASSAASPSAPVAQSTSAPAAAATADANQPAAAEQKPSVTTDMLASTLNAHPITTQRSDSEAAETPPTIDTSAQGGQAAPEPTISASAELPTLAVPDAAPTGPVHVGGKIREPKLRSYREPIYPMVAKQLHAEGDVVVDTGIDKAGNVVSTKVVSGPTVLRQAALDALRQWKYEPSTLDGQPVAIQMLVTIKFRF